MISTFSCAIVALCAAIAGVLCGMLVQKRKPGILRRLAGMMRPPPPPVDDAVRRYGKWSIAIYEGPTPFNLAPAADITNPVISTEDVTDADAILVADPFIVRRDDTWHMFFEVLPRDTERGVIARAESTDGRQWHYRGIIIREDFHMSYPQVFEWEGTIYMIPESAEDFSVRLYRAVSFPENWECVVKLLTGHDYSDATLFRHDGGWWMFASNTRNNVLNLYFSDDLTHGWQPHPMNPVVRNDPHHARPAGRVIEVEGKLHRLAQDCAPHYGTRVFAIEITELSRVAYAEKPAPETPVVTASGTGWNSLGMHHVDAHFIDGRWLAAVDGKTC
jgi:hypothetical protein